MFKKCKKNKCLTFWPVIEMTSWDFSEPITFDCIANQTHRDFQKSALRQGRGHSWSWLRTRHWILALNVLVLFCCYAFVSPVGSKTPQNSYVCVCKLLQLHFKMHTEQSAVLDVIMKSGQEDLQWLQQFYAFAVILMNVKTYCIFRYTK